MSHICCSSCRLRFDPAASACLVACPECGELLTAVATLEHALGYRLVRYHDVLHALPEAIAVTVPHPDPDGHRP